MPYQQPHGARCPKLVPILDEDPTAPRGNVITHDLCWQGQWDEIEDTARPLLRAEYWRMARKPARRLDDYTILYGQDDHRVVMRCDPATELYQELDRSPGAPPGLHELQRQVEAGEKSVESYRPAESAFAAPLRAQALVGSERVARVGAVGIEILREPIWLQAIATRPDLVARHLDVQVERAIRNATLVAERGCRYMWSWPCVCPSETRATTSGAACIRPASGCTAVRRRFCRGVGQSPRRASAPADMPQAAHTAATQGTAHIAAPSIPHLSQGLKRAAGSRLPRGSVHFQ